MGQDSKPVHKPRCRIINGSHAVALCAGECNEGESSVYYAILFSDAPDLHLDTKITLQLPALETKFDR